MRDVGLLPQFVEEKLVDSIKMELFSPTFAKIGPQHRSKLRFIQKIDPIQLFEAVKHFRG
jgi:hypothetical protein